MGFRTSYDNLERQLQVLSRRIGAEKSAKHYESLRKSQGLPYLHLNSEQKNQVRDVWNGRVKQFKTHDLLLSVTGKFDPYIMSELLFRTDIEIKLNSNFKIKYGFTDKNYFDRLVIPKGVMPKTVLRNINGVLLDSDYRPISKEQATELMKGFQKLIVKPSIESGFGKSVSLYKNEDFGEITKDYQKNFIVQEVLEQYEGVSVLNPTSINVVRVVSLSLNGKVSPVNYALRCGAAGSITDNQITKDGRGMFVVGVNKDGTLKDEAYYSCGEKISVAPNGQIFAGMKLPNFSQALELTTQIHESLPHFGFIGFDVYFNKDGSPGIMELNIKGPGMLYYQYANGPLLGERTQEVIDTFCK